MKYMYELMQRKISKENAALLTAALVLAAIGVLTAVVMTILGLWAYAEQILPVVILFAGLGLLLWILNL